MDRWRAVRRSTAVARDLRFLQAAAKEKEADRARVADSSELADDRVRFRSTRESIATERNPVSPVRRRIPDGARRRFRQKTRARRPAARWLSESAATPESPIQVRSRFPTQIVRGVRGIHGTAGSRSAAAALGVRRRTAKYFAP